VARRSGGTVTGEAIAVAKGIDLNRVNWIAVLLSGLATGFLGAVWARLALTQQRTCEDYYSNAVGGSGAEAAAMKCVADALGGQQVGWSIAALGIVLIGVAVVLGTWQLRERSAIHPTSE
jgi:hypothetical protein